MKIVSNKNFSIKIMVSKILSNGYPNHNFNTQQNIKFCMQYLLRIYNKTICVYI